MKWRSFLPQMVRIVCLMYARICACKRSVLCHASGLMYPAWHIVSRRTSFHCAVPLLAYQDACLRGLCQVSSLVGMPQMPAQLDKQKLYEMGQQGVPRCQLRFCTIIASSLPAETHMQAAASTLAVAAPQLNGLVGHSSIPMHLVVQFADLLFGLTAVQRPPAAVMRRVDAEAALQVADNDGEAAMLFHVASLPAGAAAAAPAVFLERLTNLGITRCWWWRGIVVSCITPFSNRGLL